MSLRNFPALGAALGQMAVAVILAFPVHLTVIQTGAIEAATVAVLGLIVAAFTRPFQYSAATGFLMAGGTLLLAFKIRHITPGELSALSAIISAFAFKLTHNAVSVTLPGAAPPVAQVPRA